MRQMMDLERCQELIAQCKYDLHEAEKEKDYFWTASLRKRLSFLEKIEKRINNRRYQPQPEQETR